MNSEVQGLNVEFGMAKPRIRTVQEFQAHAVFTNKSRSNLRLNTLFLHIPQVLIKTRRADGTPVHPSLPPLPPADDGHTGRIELAPGQSAVFRYKGSDYFGSALPLGKYQARFIFENIDSPPGEWSGRVESGWIDFEVVH